MIEAREGHAHILLRFHLRRKFFGLKIQAVPVSPAAACQFVDTVRQLKRRRKNATAKMRGYWEEERYG
jgi:hypothetical protein